MHRQATGRTTRRAVLEWCLDVCNVGGGKHKHKQGAQRAPARSTRYDQGAERRAKSVRSALLLLNVVELSKEAAVPDLPHDDAKREDVGLLRHDVRAQHLGCEVLHRAVLDARHLAILGRHLHRKTEVTELGCETPRILHAVNLFVHARQSCVVTTTQRHTVVKTSTARAGPSSEAR